MPESSANVLSPKGNSVGPLRTQRDRLTVVGNHRTVTVTAAPATDAVTLADAQAFMRIDAGTDDARITSLITACQNSIEDQTLGQKLITQTLQLVLDQFGDLWTELEHGPVASVTSVTVSGTLVDADRYRLANNGTGSDARLLDDNTGLPTPTEDFADIIIVYVVGYGAAADVPENIKNALLWYVQEAYDDPKATLPPISRSLLQSHIEFKV